MQPLNAQKEELRVDEKGFRNYFNRMTKQLDISERIFRLYTEFGDFRPAAYGFVADAVEYTIAGLAAARHITARELLDGMRSYAKNEFGPLSDFVLQDWGIRNAHDIGTLVYRMIAEGILGANPNDRQSDFDCEYELFPPSAEPRRRRRAKVPRIE